MEKKVWMLKRMNQIGMHVEQEAKDRNEIEHLKIKENTYSEKCSHENSNLVIEEVEAAVDALFVCLFDLILYVPSTIFQLYRDVSSWVEPVLS